MDGLRVPIEVWVRVLLSGWCVIIILLCMGIPCCGSEFQEFTSTTLNSHTEQNNV